MKNANSDHTWKMGLWVASVFFYLTKSLNRSTLNPLVALKNLLITH